MAKTAKSKNKDEDKDKDEDGKVGLSEAAFFKAVLLAALVLCGVVYGSPLQNVFLAEYGLYANLAVLFYLLAFVFGVKSISAINLENWQRWRGLAVLSLAALVMAAEELRWGLPFLLEEAGEWRIQRIRDLLSVALTGIPEGADLWLAGIVAGTRLLLVLVLIYAAGGALYFRRALPPLWKKVRAHPAFLYGAFFLVFLVLMIVLPAETPTLSRMFGAYLRMGAGLAFLMGLLNCRPDGPRL